MSQVIGDTLGERTVSKCAKLTKPLRGKIIAWNSTGSRENNELIKLLKCQCKNAQPQCTDVLKFYEQCHGGVMGGGVHTATGRKHCGEELMALFACTVEGK